MEKPISATEQYVKDHHLIVDMDTAYHHTGGHLETDEHAQEEMIHALPQAISRSILDAIKHAVPVLNESVSFDLFSKAHLLALPDIAELEVNEEDKKRIIDGILSDIAEKITDAMWVHQHAETVDKLMDEALVAGKEEIAMHYGEQWEMLRERVKQDIGILPRE